MDAMLQSVRAERQLYSHNQCVQYMCTYSQVHNIGMNRAGILALVLALHGSLTMAKLRPANFDHPHSSTYPQGIWNLWKKITWRKKYLQNKKMVKKVHISLATVYYFAIFSCVGSSKKWNFTDWVRDSVTLSSIWNFQYNKIRDKG